MFWTQFDVSIVNMSVQKLSVFFPAFNEEKNIVSTIEKAENILKTLNLEDYEILVIDDGSKDKTGEVAEHYVKTHDKVRVIHQENGGYGAALQSGFYESKYDWVTYTDADGQFDFSEVTKFLDKTGEVDLIVGYRIKRSDPFIRLVIAKGWAALLFIFFGLKLRDVDCGFKMLSRKLLDEIPHLQSTRGGMINAELAIKAEKYGFKIIQVGVNHYPRLYGQPTGAGIKVIVNSFIDLIKFWIKFRTK